jgi:hypothetical protein
MKIRRCNDVLDANEGAGKGAARSRGDSPAGSVYIAADERPYGRLAFSESRELTLRKGDPRGDRTRRAKIRSLPLGCHTPSSNGRRLCQPSAQSAFENIYDIVSPLLAHLADVRLGSAQRARKRTCSHRPVA